MLWICSKLLLNPPCWVSVQAGCSLAIILGRNSHLLFIFTLKAHYIMWILLPPLVTIDTTNASAGNLYCTEQLQVVLKVACSSVFTALPRLNMPLHKVSNRRLRWFYGIGHYLKSYLSFSEKVFILHPKLQLCSCWSFHRKKCHIS